MHGFTLNIFLLNSNLQEFLMSYIIFVYIILIPIFSIIVLHVYNIFWESMCIWMDIG